MSRRCRSSPQRSAGGALDATVSFAKLFQERSKRPLQWADLAEGRLKPRPPKPQRRVPTFFPCRLPPHAASAWGPRAPPFLAKQESRSGAVLRVAPVASDASSLASGQAIAIEAAWCGLETEKETLQWLPSAPSRSPHRTSSPVKSSEAPSTEGLPRSVAGWFYKASGGSARD